MSELDLAAIGIGPFHLSLAALLEKERSFNALFFDQKKNFEWHSELMFADADMQTSFMKDLVTPVDPTNANSFLNYLVSNDLFYSFMNTGRRTIARREFEQYGRWVAQRLKSLRFSHKVESVRFDGSIFEVGTSQGRFRSKDICVGTGPIPRVPDATRDLINDRIFHAKSEHLKNLRVDGLDVAIIGGGQTGIEVFRSCFGGLWGSARSVTLVSRRDNLEPLDESPFTNEYFAPGYVESFHHLPESQKRAIVAKQKLASDGNTPAYLQALYNDLYRIKNVEGDRRPIRILPMRNLECISKRDSGYELQLSNRYAGANERLFADVVILCTGFETRLPLAIEPLLGQLDLDERNLPKLERNFRVKWNGPATNRIYAVNFGRFSHGIAEPQTSLMAWRSATIINDLFGRTVYPVSPSRPSFLHYDRLEESF
jgi:lysine N6-hydroxylase